MNSYVDRKLVLNVVYYLNSNKIKFTKFIASSYRHS